MARLSQTRKRRYDNLGALVEQIELWMYAGAALLVGVAGMAVLFLDEDAPPFRDLLAVVAFSLAGLGLAAIAVRMAQRKRREQARKDGGR